MLISGINASLVRSPLKNGRALALANDPSRGPDASSFADVLKNSVDEVARLQQKSGQGVQDLVTGRTDNIARVLSDAEKAGLAFNVPAGNPRQAHGRLSRDQEYAYLTARNRTSRDYPPLHGAYEMLNHSPEEIL